MNIKVRDKLLLHLEAFRNSYSQVFFSDNRWFALILLLVSFIDLYAGISGALMVMISNLLSESMGFHSWFVRKGYYGFNSLLVGLGFGLTFHPGLIFFILIPVFALLTFLFTVAFQGFFYHYRLPYLSIPFLIVIWILMFSSGEFTALGLSVRGIYKLNELYSVGGIRLIEAVDWFDHLIVHPGLRTYLLSLGAIFFQQNLLAGILIAFGILVYSRIAFSLSIAGFLLAWFFYRITGADMSTLGYNYIGFNYILTSIALGGFFIIPSRWSYLWLLWLLPMVIVVTVSFQKLFGLFQLGVYALPFNIVVLTFLYVLKIREKPGHRLVETPVQLFSPEKNLYHLQIHSERFPGPDYEPVTLPVLGEWTVSQASHGDLTHKGEWAHAIDLVMTGSDGFQYRGEGASLSDYYCYGKPVVAVADGTVADITDGISDNEVGENNLLRNWGNSVVLKHSDHLFSQVSHLKPGSLRVRKGDHVNQGNILGLCGNSGRSPYPHLHFQFQATPNIGSKTIHYPLSHYLTGTDGILSLKTHSIPAAGEKITSIQNHPLLEKAFRILPGKRFVFEVTATNADWLQGRHEWEVKADEYNNSYLECIRSGATAYFYNNGNIHYFVNYLGTRKSLLYYFYLAFYQVITGYYQGLIIREPVPPDKTGWGFSLFFQDFIAPFHIFLKPGYELTYEKLEEDFYSSKALLKAFVRKNRKTWITAEIELAGNCISGFSLQSEKIHFKAICAGIY